MNEDDLEDLRRSAAELREQSGAIETLASLGYAKAQDGSWRQHSKAGVIGGLGPATYQSTTSGGEFIRAVMQARSRDAQEQSIGKAALNGLSQYIEVDPQWGVTGTERAKATLGLTDATGGWVIPGPLVDNIVKPGLGSNSIYRNLITVRTGVNTASIDIPSRATNVSRAVIAAWGELKENRNLAYNGYTATMYTMALVYDLAKQFVRTSAGAAEQDVLSELAKAFGLGTDFYVREGVGTTEPYGIVTALGDAFGAFTTAHTAAGNTVAGSVASAIAKAASALVSRGRKPEAAVMSANGYAEMLTNGADTAGFFLSGISGPQSLPGFQSGTLVSPWGIPVLVDPGFASDDLIVAEWSAFKLYEGPGYRVDTSDEAGDRWDRNLIGYRGELELAFDARPAVFAGAAQLVTDILS